MIAWDVRRAKLFGRCEARTGIASFDLLVSELMEQEPYRSARRVFWVVHNGSSHGGQAAVDRLQSRRPNLVLVHLPVHASWLNQAEIYFSVLQRKVLSSNEDDSLESLVSTIYEFQSWYEQSAKAFEWKFTKRDLLLLLQRVEYPNSQYAEAAQDTSPNLRIRTLRERGT